MFEMMICIMVLGNLECDWTLFYGTPDEIYDGCGEIGLAGCVYLGNHKEIYVSNRYQIDEHGYPTLWHEIKHAQCMCNWHE